MRFCYVILLALVCALANAKKQSTCREPVVVVKNFDLEGILGHWYEYLRLENDFEAGCDCLTVELDAIDAYNVQISACCQMNGGSNETQTCDFGINKITDTGSVTKDATLAYTRAGSTVESSAWIIDTDYDHLMIVGGCDLVSDDEDREVFWVLSRDKQITENEARKINKVLKDNNFDRSKIIKLRHEVDLCTAKLPKNLHRRRHRLLGGN